MLADEDHVTIYLKDKREQYPDSEHELWYARAFGPKRNLMTITFKYTPLDS